MPEAISRYDTQPERRIALEKTYEPRVIAFCCHYCAYSAADLAGSMRIEYSPNVRIIKLMCTGKLDTLHLLKAFEDGADAVFAAG
jgi:F420-non-reducing hydrogenase iron-sulfur subunit